MKRILLTGISGVGKSVLIVALAARGYKAVDVDAPDWSEWLEVRPDDPAAGSPVEPGRDWIWRADRVRALLATEDAPVLFISGSAANMRQFLPQFDHVILLSAPEAVIVERLATRTTNNYGKQPHQVARVLDLKQTVEPLLRAAAGQEIDTSAPLAAVVATVLQIVE